MSNNEQGAHYNNQPCFGIVLSTSMSEMLLLAQKNTKQIRIFPYKFIQVQLPPYLISSKLT